MRPYLLFICLFFISWTMNAQLRLQGTAPAYAGDELVFYTYSDLLTYTEKEIVRCKVAPGGRFDMQCTTDAPVFLFAHLDSYFAYFYASPKGSYVLHLPEKRAKTQEDKINPFFSETPVHLGIETNASEDINYMMMVFDGYYNEYYADMVEKMRGNNPNPFDKNVLLLDTLFRSEHNDLFEQYKHYRIGLFKQQAGYQKSKALSQEYFIGRPVLYTNTGYMELFHQVYARYFEFLSRSKEGRDISMVINKNRSLSQLKKIMLADGVFQDDALLEMVMLKNLYDNFYRDDFSRSALLAILDSLQTTTCAPQHVTIASNIRKKVTQLMAGYEPPAFELYDMQGKLHTLADFKGKAVYLNFCTVSSYGCLKEFVELDRLYKKYRGKVEIVSVCVDEDVETIRNFLSYEPYKWTFLHYTNQPGILSDYDIRAYPTYYLIDKEGKLSHSLAPSPAKVERIFSNL